MTKYNSERDVVFPYAYIRTSIKGKRLEQYDDIVVCVCVKNPVNKQINNRTELFIKKLPMRKLLIEIVLILWNSMVDAKNSCGIIWCPQMRCIIDWLKGYRYPMCDCVLNRFSTFCRVNWMFHHENDDEKLVSPLVCCMEMRLTISCCLKWNSLLVDSNESIATQIHATWFQCRL